MKNDRRNLVFNFSKGITKTYGQYALDEVLTLAGVKQHTLYEFRYGGCAMTVETMGKEAARRKMRHSSQEITMIYYQKSKAVSESRDLESKMMEHAKESLLTICG